MTEPEYLWYRGSVIKLTSMVYHEEGTYCLNGVDANGYEYNNWWMGLEEEYSIATKADWTRLRLRNQFV